MCMNDRLFLWTLWSVNIKKNTRVFNVKFNFMIYFQDIRFISLFIWLSRSLSFSLIALNTFSVCSSNSTEHLLLSYYHLLTTIWPVSLWILLNSIWSIICVISLGKPKQDTTRSLKAHFIFSVVVLLLH